MAPVVTSGELAQFIESYLLRPDASLAEIEKLCAQAREHRFFSVCVNGSWVAAARHFLDGSEVKVAGTVGFPFGAVSSDVKRYETEVAIDDGAHEIDVVLNIARLKAGEDKYVLRELIDVAEAADERTVKVILETCLLTEAEKIRASQLVVDSGAHFVTTSSGFSPIGATIPDLKLLRETVGPKFGVMAAGGILDAQSAQALIEAGATRLGISSNIAILNGPADGETH
jgi:deoxyribose-phosphate aldolase